MDNEGFRTEELMGGIFGHEAILDILACDYEGRFYDIERERLTGLCRLADFGRTLQFLINGHIMPSVSVSGG